MKYLVFVLALFLVSCDGEGGGSILFGGTCEIPALNFCVEYDEDLSSTEAESDCSFHAGRIVDDSSYVFVSGTLTSCSVSPELSRCVIDDEDQVVIYGDDTPWNDTTAGADCVGLGGNYITF